MTTESETLGQLARYGVIPVVRTPSAAIAETAILWLREAGYGTFEITLTNPGALTLIATLAREPDLLVGAGTVLSAADAEAVIDAGARYVVAPGVVPEVAAVCRSKGVPVLLGALTPTEVHQAVQAGATAVKLFPASTVGPGHLKALAAVFPAVKFVPTGGVDSGSVASWVRAGAYCVGAGGKLVDPALVREGARATVIAVGRELLAAYQTARGTLAVPAAG